MCKNKYFDTKIIYYSMSVLDTFNLYNKLLVQSMATPEKIVTGGRGT
jgi:hypothetical protein